MAAPEVVWSVVRDHHAFMVRRDGVTFSGEPLNLTNTHSYKWSEFPQSKAAGVQQEGGRVVLKTATKHHRKPKAAVKTVPLAKGHDRSIDTVNKRLYSGFYRPDLRSAALARYAALKRTSRTRQSKGVVRSVTARRVRHG